MAGDCGQPAPRRYVVIMPCRNEEQFIQHTLDCVVAQTVPPVECVVVNDGSSDATGTIAEEMAAKHDWIHVVHRDDRGERKVGGGVVDTFYSGFEALKTDDYRYLCKMDADLTLQPGYFEHAIGKMEADPKLGGTSGKVFNPLDDGTTKEEAIIDQMVSGAMNFWRRECWEEIGGFVREVMWDGIAMHRASLFGWVTRSFRDEELRIIHHRLMGSSHKSIYFGRTRWGRGQWFMGTHPLYILASGVWRLRERPYIIGGALIVTGYIRAWMEGARRYDDLRFRRHLHRWQLDRLHLGWLAPKEP